MTWYLKDLHISLLQRDPAREAGASPPGGRPPLPRGALDRKRPLHSRAGARLGMLMALLALPLSLWIADGEDMLPVRLGSPGVTPLPDPSAASSLDDQARYWTFALYDFDALGRRFQVGGRFAIDGKRARSRLDRLLPHVSRRTLGEISAYTSIAYHAVPRSRVRP